MNTKKALFFVPLVVACGGAHEQPPPKEPTTTVTTSSDAKPTPAPFTGSYEIVSMGDAKSTVIIADLLKKAQAVDGRMTWEFGASDFQVGIWQVAAPLKMGAADDNLYSFCRATAKVSAHWEGLVLVLASPVEADGAATSFRVEKKSEAGKTTRRTTNKNAGCQTSYAGTRLTFTIVEKDEQGPTKLRAVGDQGATIELVRGKAPADVDPKAIVDAL